MSRGENIFKRKDGRWEARYIKGYELSGKIRYGFCYGRSYHEAKEKVTKCRADLLSGKSLPAVQLRCRFSYYCGEWLRVRKPKIRESTYVKYETILKRHILPKLGLCFPENLTGELIGELTNELLFEDELAPKTVHDILVVLHGVLKYTSSLLAGSFPVPDIVYPRVSRKETRVLSREEQRALIAFLLDGMDDCRFGILLALFTGIRIGELCALRWENISAEERTVRIASTLQRLRDTSGSETVRTRIVIGLPKSETSIRTIPLTEYAAELCGRMGPHPAGDYVLTGTENYMEPRTLQYRLEKYTRSCGLEGVHFHTLRHTFATRAVEVGFELKSLSEVLGHATTTITLERYVHSSIELKRNNMNKLSAVGL